MRKRYEENSDLPEVTRPNGALSETETEEIRQAYRDGCKGQILIGMRGEERVITMLLPALGNTETNMIQITGKMKEIGCDRYIWIRNKIDI